MKKVLVCGGGGFIGSHVVKRLKRDGYWVRAFDLKLPEYSESAADDFVIGDLRDQSLCRNAIDRDFDEVYQLAADMGGADYIFTGKNDAEIMINSATINVNVLAACRQRQIGSLFYSSSACIYPVGNQIDEDHPICREDSAYPAEPDSEYGWEKLFGERLFLAHRRNHGLNAHIARYHNIFGPEGPWRGGTGEGARGDLPEGGDGQERRIDRDLGRWEADAIVPLYRGMHRGHDAAGALGLRGSGKYRFRADGHDRPTRRSYRRYSRQADRKASCRGAGRRSGQKLRQSTDPREIELGSVFSSEAWAGADLCVDRRSGAQFVRTAQAWSGRAIRLTALISRLGMSVKPEDHKPPQSRLVVSNRWDGLGARLTSLANAWSLAKRLEWSSDSSGLTAPRRCLMRLSTSSARAFVKPSKSPLPTSQIARQSPPPVFAVSVCPMRVNSCYRQGVTRSLRLASPSMFAPLQEKARNLPVIAFARRFAGSAGVTPRGTLSTSCRTGATQTTVQQSTFDRRYRRRRVAKLYRPREICSDATGLPRHRDPLWCRSKAGGGHLGQPSLCRVPEATVSHSPDAARHPPGLRRPLRASAGSCRHPFAFAMPRNCRSSAQRIHGTCRKFVSAGGATPCQHDGGGRDG